MRIKANSIKLKNITAMGFTKGLSPQENTRKESRTSSRSYKVETISVSAHCGVEMEIPC